MTAIKVLTAPARQTASLKILQKAAGDMRDDVLDALTMVIDPEVGIDIVALGLVERLECTPERIDLGLIMTTPICPQGHHLVEQARDIVQSRFPNTQVNAELLMEPFWEPSRMSPMARQTLGWGG